jgi:hypothetical protein
MSVHEAGGGGVCGVVVKAGNGLERRHGIITDNLINLQIMQVQPVLDKLVADFGPGGAL